MMRSVKGTGKIETERAKTLVVGLQIETDSRAGDEGDSVKHLSVLGFGVGETASVENGPDRDEG